jgi:O-methyltransferase
MTVFMVHWLLNQPSEKSKQPQDRTRGNLKGYGSQVELIPGFLPESMDAGGMPPELHWLHIDLNAALATHGVLERCHDRLSRGGVILFDDYAWHGYEDTRGVVDEFLRSRPGCLLPLATGQAVFLKP